MVEIEQFHNNNDGFCQDLSKITAISPIINKHLYYTATEQTAIKYPPAKENFAVNGILIILFF